MNNYLKSLSLFCAIVFTVLFISTFYMSEFLKKEAYSFFKAEMVQGLHEEYGLVSRKATSFKSMALKIGSKLDEKIGLGDSYLVNYLEPMVADVMQVDYERVKTIPDYKKYNNYLIGELEKKREQVKSFMRMKYEDIMQKLTLELKIFTGGNAFLFLFLYFVMMKKKVYSPYLMYVIGVTLLISLIGTYLYLFNQNWFFTILYSDYMGSQYFYLLGMSLLIYFLHF